MRLKKIRNALGKKKFYLYMAASLLILGGAVLVVAGVTRFVRQALYAERCHSLTELTAASAGTVNEAIRAEWSLVDVFAGLVYSEIDHYEDPEKFIRDMNLKLSDLRDRWFVVDENGKYYCSDGESGRITDMDRYTSDSADRLEYISTLPHLSYSEPDRTFLIFRRRLDGALSKKSGDQGPAIRYCGILYDLTELEQSVSGLYSGVNNTFIYDSGTGVMLYRQFGLGTLISGFNVYSKFSGTLLPYGEDPEDLIRKLMNREILVTEMSIGDVRYYLCSAPLNNDSWSLLYVVQQKEVARASDSRFRYIMLLVAVMVGALGVAAMVIIQFIGRSRSVARELENHRMIETQRDQLEVQQKRLEVALHQAESSNRSKTVFLNNMSHDIRTPMNAIIGFNERARKCIADPVAQNYLQKAGQASSHLLALINDVLDMSRIESGKVVLQEKPENLAVILREVRDIVYSGMISKGLNFIVEASGICHENVVTDRLRLNQILLNLLSNAQKYTEKGSVWLKIREERTEGKQGAFVFIVKDTGLGMSPEFLETIFEPFTRESTSTISGIQGTGLGMSITKNIIDIMGGSIHIDSTPGVGTEITMRFRFPILPDREGEPLPQFENMRALIIDDDQESAGSTASAFFRGGLLPETAVGAETGLQKAEEALQEGRPYGLVVVSWIMSGLSGVLTAKKLRELCGDQAYIVLLSAYDWSEIEQTGREAGINAFHTRPLFPSDVEKILKDCLGYTEPEEKTEELPVFSGKKILLVEDNELNREIAEELLEEVGFRMDVAEDGSIALDKVRSGGPGRYDLILMDIQMPVMNGYDAAKAIRALPDPALSGIPIVAMTANAFAEDRKEALEAGMNEHLAKPVEVGKLYEIMAKILKEGGK